MSENPSLPVQTTTTFSAHSKEAEDFKPYLILVATDRQNKQHETENKGVSEKQVLKLKAGTHRLWLTIDHHKRCPSDCQILRESMKTILDEKDKNLSLDQLGRKFDTEKKVQMDMQFKQFQPDGELLNSTIEKLMLKAITTNEFPLGSRKFTPGSYQIKLIGPIHFKYLDYNGNLRIIEEAQFDLNFWFEVDEKQKQDSSSEDDSDTSSHKGYYTEAEVR